MPYGFLAGLILGLLAFLKEPGNLGADLVLGITLGGSYDAFKLHRWKGLFSWPFLIFFATLTGLFVHELQLNKLRLSECGFIGCLLGAAVWWATHWARLRSGRPIGRWPGALALLFLALTAVNSTVGLCGMFVAFVWWVWQAFTGVLRSNPQRLAIEARRREAKRPF